MLVHVDGVAAELGGALKLKRKDLSRPAAGDSPAAALAAPRRTARTKKVPRQLVGLEGAASAEAAPPPVATKAEPQMRTVQNTLDLRGFRYDDAERETDYFLDRQSRAGAARCFVLHGHGTGALKKGLRSYPRPSETSCPSVLILR